MKSEPKTQPVPIRLDPQLRSRIKTASGAVGTNASAFIRFAVLNQLRELERTGELRISAAAK